MTKLSTSPFANDHDVAHTDAARTPAPAPDPTEAPLDADAISGHDWPTCTLSVSGADRPPGFTAIYTQSALDEIHLHGQSAPSIEVCGVLVGRTCRDRRGPYLFVEHVIRGDAASSRSTNVTFTAETWQHIQSEMDRKYPDKRIVGWYHTHPGFDIFLSEMDLFICDNFFNLPWQSAFVYDPQSGDEGNFVWRKGKPTREPLLIEDDVTPKAAAVPLISVADVMAGPDAAAGSASAATAPSADIAPLMARVERLERRQRFLFITVAFFAAFVAMWAAQVSPEGSQWLRQLLAPLLPASTAPAPPAAQDVAKPASPSAARNVPPIAAPHAAPAPASHPPAAPRQQWPPAAPVPEVLRQ